MVNILPYIVIGCIFGSVELSLFIISLNPLALMGYLLIIGTQAYLMNTVSEKPEYKSNKKELIIHG
jgi:hypothetical protein